MFTNKRKKKRGSFIALFMVLALIEVVFGIAGNAMTVHTAYADEALSVESVDTEQALSSGVYVSDGASVLDEQTSTMVNGLNVKFAGMTKPMALYVATRSGNLAQSDADNYGKTLFSKLGLASVNSGSAVLITLAPDTGSYTVTVGDNVPADVKTALSDKYLDNEDTNGLVKSKDWPATVKYMVATTDDRVAAAINGNVTVKNVTEKKTVKKVVAAPTADEIKAKADAKVKTDKAAADRAKAEEKAEKAKSKSTNSVLKVVVHAFGSAIIIGLILALLFGSLRYVDSYRKGQRKEARRSRIQDVLERSGIVDSEGLDEGNNLGEIIDFVGTSNADGSDASSTKLSENGVLTAARLKYERDVLPAVLEKEGTYMKDKYADYVNNAPKYEKRAWWTPSGFDVQKALADADASIENEEDLGGHFDRAYNIMKSSYPVAFRGKKDDDLKAFLMDDPEWRKHVVNEGDNAWKWMWKTLKDANMIRLFGGGRF